jgi:nucleoid-associated protein YgaU
MFTVQDDWIEYEALSVPARRVAVRGGAACAQRMPIGGLQPTTAPALRAVAPSGRITDGRAARSRSAQRSARRSSRLRLTRRGRIVLVVLPALLLLSGTLLATASGPAEAAPRAAAQVAPRTVIVGTGDTLWTIAERIAPGADPRDTVLAIERANGLSTDRIDAGTPLVLPVAD